MIKQRFFIFIFITIISLPCLLLFLGDKDEAFENLKEELFELNSPSGIKTFIIKSRRYFLDNYKTKKIVYSFYKKNISDRFTETPSVSNVLYGKEDWLFIGDKHNNAFSEAKGVLSFTDSELEKIKKNIELCKAWCKQEGIEFYIAIPPGKHTVYKEYLPYNFPERVTKLDQFISIENQVIDMREMMQNGKNNEDGRLYFKTDTHWNEIGAFYGYKAIMESIQKKQKGLSFYDNEDVKKVSYTYKQGDISRILDESTDQEEKTPQVIFKNNTASKIASRLDVPSYHRFDPWSYEIRYSNPKALNPQKIMFFRDSYSTSLIPYFSASFNETLFIYNHYFDKELIKNEKPDIFLYEITERFIDRLLTIHTK